jgi:hypothetical protein
MKKGYNDLFARNEYAYKLDSKGLEGLIMQATGLEKGSRTLDAIRKTFQALNSFADFDKELVAEESDGEAESVGLVHTPAPPGAEAARLNLSYTIYLNLPRTNDISVFDAIFRSLKENLLTP